MQRKEADKARDLLAGIAWPKSMTVILELTQLRDRDWLGRPTWGVLMTRSGPGLRDHSFVVDRWPTRDVLDFFEEDAAHLVASAAKVAVSGQGGKPPAKGYGPAHFPRNEPPPRWLKATIIGLRIADDVHPAARRLAINVVRSVEAEGIATPFVRGFRGSAVIRWENMPHKPGSLELTVHHSGLVQVAIWFPGSNVPPLEYRVGSRSPREFRDLADTLRGSLGALYFVQGASLEEMEALCFVQRK